MWVLSFGIPASHRISQGSIAYIFQYATSTFGWTSETLGYWISLLGVTRALFLTVMLPVIIKMFQSKSKPVHTSEETRSLLTPTSDSFGNTPGSLGALDSSPPPTPHAASFQAQPPLDDKHYERRHAVVFDLQLARVSLVVDMIAYVFIGISSTTFIVFGVLTSFGAGFSPAMQSVTLAMYARRGGTESGRLLGGMSVIAALSAQILGPAIYGLVYMRTVATYPRTIFFVSLGKAMIALLMLTFVSLRRPSHLTDSINTEGGSAIPGVEQTEEDLVLLNEELGGPTAAIGI